MKALSLRQPWAAAVMHLGKRIENRRWNTSFRGEFLIHAAKGMTEREWEAAHEFCGDALCETPLSVHTWFDIDEMLGENASGARKRLQFGGIVGIARLVDVVAPRPEVVLSGVERWYPPHARDDWRWHMREQFGFVLTDIRPTNFVPLKGSRGFFDVDEMIAARALQGVP